MTHANAPLSVEGCRRLIERCMTRPIAQVAGETGVSRATASKRVNRHRRHGGLGARPVLLPTPVPARWPPFALRRPVARLLRIGFLVSAFR